MSTLLVGCFQKLPIALLVINVLSLLLSPKLTTVILDDRMGKKKIYFYKSWPSKFKISAFGC